ncbi:GLIPR1-like protein 1 [Thalassophryne amazonica]|uniref:GLIPR1-like protein 1 n=1 Tax=Thalassophryne amazonica TaxID=390379 RepID=UPI0014711A41|nr:GLIPR1-like protein 1 [Thalassophryne amazonica]
MKSVVENMLWVWIILLSAGSSVPLPDITDGKFIEECVRAHNSARSSVQPPAHIMLYMTWDEGLAITARAWARQCIYKHNVRRTHPTFPSVGENIWAGYPVSMFNTTNAIDLWVDEKKHYDLNSNTCSDVCGHYTQVVWAQTYKVGCAVQLCTSGIQGTSFFPNKGAIFVCNYAPAGNVNRRQPYEASITPCSGCKDNCEDNLCLWPSVKPTPPIWIPEWDSALKKCGSQCVAVLTVRPVALICTFVLAYVVHRFYPNTFCYE